MKKIGFVIPWYGENIAGGAEAELRGLVHHLQAAGVELEILTTCVKNFTADWNVNYHPEGLTNEYGILVRRFLIRTRNVSDFDKVNCKLIQGREVSYKEEEIFFQESVNSLEMYQYMKEHQEEYALFVFIPYLFGTTYYGMQVCPEKSVLIPCLHEEGYAHMKLVQQMFSQCRGLVYNAEPERELANQLYDLQNAKQITMGIGMNTEIQGDAQRFRNKYAIRDPFLLYAGRKDTGKNVNQLLQYFACWENRGNTKLVLIGGGQVTIPATIANCVIDLGFVDIQDKYDAYAAATVLCQPSLHESFSLVIMESWLCGRPVLVNAGCPVTKNFVQQSNGGLWFSEVNEFCASLDYLLSHEEQAQQLGQQGADYVRKNFQWDIIIRKYLNFFAELTEAQA